MLCLIIALTFFHVPDVKADVDPSLIGEAFRSHFPESPFALQLAILTARTVLPDLVGSDNEFASRLGFANASDTNTGLLQVVPPYPVVIIELQQLLAISGECNPFDSNKNGLFLLARDYNWRLRGPALLPWRFLYPIKANGSVKSSVLIASDVEGPDNKKWKIERIGSSSLITRLYATATSAGHFVIWIPALNRFYLGSVEVPATNQYRFTLRTVFPDRTLNLPANAVMPAWEAFCRLNKEALTVDPSVPR